jgi:hypothetical protein
MGSTSQKKDAERNPKTFVKDMDKKPDKKRK